MAPKQRSSAGLVILACVTAQLALAQLCEARPPYKRALADYLGPYLTPKLNDCRTCHLPDDPRKDSAVTGEGDKPHNPFGARLKAVKAALKKAGKPTDIAARLDAI